MKANGKSLRKVLVAKIIFEDDGSGIYDEDGIKLKTSIEGEWAEFFIGEKMINLNFPRLITKAEKNINKQVKLFFPAQSDNNLTADESGPFGRWTC